MVDAALVSFAFLQGLLAFFSPCGFPMLPAYLAYYLPRAGADAPREPLARAVARGLAGGILAALGALSVLLAIGGLALAIGAPFKERVFDLELLGGALVLGLGVLVLAGKGPSLRFSLQPRQGRGALGIFAFGALYAAVAAGCVAPLFLGVVAGALAAPTVAEGALQVGAYAAGLASLLIVLTVLVTTAQDTLVRGLRRVLPHVERVSGVVLVLVGLYLMSYWWRIQQA